MAVYSKKLKAGFYKLSLPDKKNFPDLAAELHRRGFRASTTVALEEGQYARLERYGTWAESDCIEGEMARLRMEIVPEKGAIDRPLEVLELRVDEGTGERGAFLYHLPTKTLVLEENRLSIGATAFAKFFAQMFDLSAFNLDPLPEPDVVSRVFSAKRVKRVEVKLAGPITGSINVSNDAAVISALKSRKHLVAPVATFVFGTEGRKEMLPRDAALGFIREWWRLRRNGSVPVDKIAVTGFDDEEKTSFYLNLIENRLRDEEKVNAGVDRTISSEERRGALRRIWARQKDKVFKLAKHLPED
ncbi:MAG TPA: DUF6731 family protein [Clostridia bacterium]|nr:DUF6731 family protein [Clostridia bacterium]